MRLEKAAMSNWVTPYGWVVGKDGRLAIDKWGGMVKGIDSIFVLDTPVFSFV